MPPFTSFPGQDGLSETVKRLANPVPDSTINEPTLVIRQDSPPATVTVHANSGGGDINLTGGELAGVIIGCIAGTLLILWLIKSCTPGGFFAGPPARDHYHHEKPAHRRRSRHSHSRHRSPSLSAPAPVIVRDYSRSPGRGRRDSRVYY